MSEGYNKDLGHFDQFFKQNEGLIHKAVREFNYFYNVSKLVEYDDLFQEASIAFYKVYLTFDSSRGYTFSTLAHPSMRGYILIYIRTRPHTVRKSRVAVIIERLTKEYSITHADQLDNYVKELKEYNITLKYAKEMYIASLLQKNPIYLDKEVKQDENTSDTYMDFLKSSNDRAYDFDVLKDVKGLVNSMKLKEREKICIILRAQGYTYEEIGKEFGITKAAILKILRRVEGKVRRGIQEYYAKY